MAKDPTKQAKNGITAGYWQKSFINELRRQKYGIDLTGLQRRNIDS
jgi:hypothetical protein